ncbi:HAD family hydrolase [Nakamurella leprariae]|uniref:HAD family hydrolase n=1 Tax=Nakamurella leprariae TaxID=2803911 RepID=A0A939BYC3_9ACTN|nr:HAD family hydrolase [Nakamurella leprariae]MBM9466945.1 HAD family hydrolase [Nakamurella leprariae]
MARTVLFDIDGTLVDSNYLHIATWSQAFVNAGRPVDDWRIHRAIGMDSAKLLAALLELDEDQVDHDETAQRAKSAHRELYRAVRHRLRPFDGARELLRSLAERGHRVVLATSAPPEELAALLEVLDAEAWLAAVTSSDDVDTAKPDPDIVQVALDKVGADAADAVFVGDAVWDGAAATRAGVRFVAVRSGGAADADLRDAGAMAVHDDVAGLLATLDHGPLVS